MSTSSDIFDRSPDTISIAIVIGFWTMLSWFAWVPIVGRGLNYTGLVIGLYYAVVQGADQQHSEPHPTSPAAVLRANGRLLVLVGPWFLAAIAIYGISGLWDLVGLPGLFISPAIQ
ncbi:hypothetical protein [Halocatena halophila]|uniref:hypothetical protein n=1 Tax=Halocatena halophila TaxID=2814576 RepID=UPI002ED4BF7A